jgi:putative MFS transporter
MASVFIMCAGFITFAYIAESYPTRMRNTSVGTHLAAGRLATSFWQPGIPMIFGGAGIFGARGISGFMGVYGLVAFMVFVPRPIVVIWGMRTGGKSLEEID